jgi:hypothetical protein
MPLCSRVCSCAWRFMLVAGYQRIVGQDYWFGDYPGPVVLATNPDTEQACADECTNRPDCTLYTYHPLTALPAWTQPGANCILKVAAASEWVRQCMDSMDGPCICPGSTEACAGIGANDTITGIKVRQVAVARQVCTFVLLFRWHAFHSKPLFRTVSICMLRGCLAAAARRRAKLDTRLVWCC